MDARKTSPDGFSLGEKPNGVRVGRRWNVVDCFEVEAQGIEFFPTPVSHVV
jgi:hypothetical protein